MGKTPLILAPLIVFAAVVWLSVWVGIRIGRAREARERAGVDPQWVGRVRVFLSGLLTPPDNLAAMEDMVVLPAAKREAAVRLMYEAPGSFEVRADRRAQRDRRGH